MGAIANLLGIGAAAPSPYRDDHWAQVAEAPGLTSASGVKIDADTALSIATVYACVRIISSTLGVLPLFVMERDGRTRERAPNHPLDSVLHDTPNPRQNSFQWRQTGMMHILLRGATYSEQIMGRGGRITELEPLNPDRVTPEKMANRHLRFHYMGEDGEHPRNFSQDDLFFLMGISPDGVTPISVIQYAKESFGLAYAAESFGSRLFSQGAVHRGALKHPGKISPEARDRIRQEVSETHTGLRNAHKPMLLQEGMEWQSISITPEDAQFLATRGFQVEEIASWFGVPLSLLQHTEKSTSWGPGLGQLMLGFLIFTMEPWLTLWEMGISQQLIDQPNFFAEFERKGLLQGDHAARSAFYRTMVQIMAMTPNEVRERENMNPLEGLDEPIVPLNVQQGRDGQEDREREADAIAEEAVIPDKYYGKALALAMNASTRMVETEIKAVKTIAKKHADNPESWAEAVQQFYSNHKADVAEELGIPLDVASVYCDGQAGDLANSGLQATERWPKDKPAKLAAIILGGEI